jgi:hypothetical protein
VVKVRVRCSYVIEVELPDTQRNSAAWVIEENGCPGTGVVGAALDEQMRLHEEQSTCWACALGGQNQIIDPDVLVAVVV